MTEYTIIDEFRANFKFKSIMYQSNVTVKGFGTQGNTFRVEFISQDGSGIINDLKYDSHLDKWESVDSNFSQDFLNTVGRRITAEYDLRKIQKSKNK